MGEASQQGHPNYQLPRKTSKSIARNVGARPGLGAVSILVKDGCAAVRASTLTARPKSYAWGSSADMVNDPRDRRSSCDVANSTHVSHPE
jgi:hypothetical protein